MSIDLDNDQINLTRDGRLTIRFDAVRMGRLDLIVAVHGVTPSEVIRAAFDRFCVEAGLSDKP